MALRVMDHLECNVIITHSAEEFAKLLWSKFTVSNSGVFALRILAVVKQSELVESLFKTSCIFVYDELYKVTKHDMTNTRKDSKDA